jgi:hypothetical protein
MNINIDEEMLNVKIGINPDIKMVYIFYSDYYTNFSNQYNPDAIHPELKKKFSTLRENTMKSARRIRMLGYTISYITEKIYDDMDFSGLLESQD